MPIPLDTRKKPADVKVHVTDGAGVDITWADGHVSHYDFSYLRDLCPCALCDDERRKRDEQSEYSTANSAINPPENPLQMFKARPRARAAKSVGHYALQIDFTDGHGAGIYSFDYLRTICPCAECAKMFRSGMDETKSP
jgi:prepilin-type processing-associated H-X9-DG protein